ncbi:hypothetical protein [Flavobacterium sp. UBA4197]|uniref:hypothetical protein n=1 Tax=Flavobacterium sp. UBA4197 TaxID=1946546 RepID=UPI00257B3CDD|nr:hypothetical protein [Flavobacterium sp. UBA4197]
MPLPLQTVLDSIAEWNRVRKDRELVTFYLNQGKFFPFECVNKGASKYLHAYPGIMNDKLFFFLIPSEFDTEQKSAVPITEYINAFPVENGLGNGQELPEKEAKQRIENWDENLNKWIKTQIDAPEGIFQAFAMPTDYLVDDTKIPYNANFALRTSPEKASGFTADLVIVDQADQKTVYYDTVRPVPPFAPLEGEFYLLQLATVTA